MVQKLSVNEVKRQKKTKFHCLNRPQEMSDEI